jgi:hypothetical protein
LWRSWLRPFKGSVNSTVRDRVGSEDNAPLMSHECARHGEMVAGNAEVIDGNDRQWREQHHHRRCG